MTFLSERRPFDELPLPTQAGIRCSDPDFIQFLREDTGLLRPGEPPAAAIYRYCRVASRRHLISMSRPGNLWRDLEHRFRRHMEWRGTPMAASGDRPPDVLPMWRREVRPEAPTHRDDARPAAKSGARELEKTFRFDGGGHD